MSALLRPDEFDNESLESFWTVYNQNGAYSEEATGVLRLERGTDTVVNSIGDGDQGLRIYQPVEALQDFDVKMKVEKIGSNWGGSDVRVHLMYRATSNTFFHVCWTGSSYGYIYDQGRYGGTAYSNQITQHGSGYGPIYLRLARSGSTITGYYSSNGTSWSAGTPRTSGELAVAGEVGIVSSSSGAFNESEVHWFRNYNVTYKFGGIISDDGEVIVISNSAAEGEIAREDQTAGSWEIYTAFSGTCSVMGRRFSDDKTVSFGGLNPVYYSGP